MPESGRDFFVCLQIVQRDTCAVFTDNLRWTDLSAGGERTADRYTQYA